MEYLIPYNRSLFIGTTWLYKNQKHLCLNTTIQVITLNQATKEFLIPFLTKQTNLSSKDICLKEEQSGKQLIVSLVVGHHEPEGDLT